MEDDQETLKKIMVSDYLAQKLTIQAIGEKGKGLDSPVDELIKDMKDIWLRIAKLVNVEKA